MRLAAEAFTTSAERPVAEVDHTDVIEVKLG
jgi:hypothetical protein